MLYQDTLPLQRQRTCPMATPWIMYTHECASNLRPTLDGTPTIHRQRVPTSQNTRYIETIGPWTEVDLCVSKCE
eukprot:m.125814 g.125814  ORF g.125814 m.125814 type:complete len:74 (+) comp11176_c5_seq1:449-670(+)